MLELRNICFTRDNKKILSNINLNVEDNKFVVITGPNGSGKSTLAKIIMGIEKADSGQVIFNGQDISNLSINERANIGIGFAFQQPVNFKGITVYDLIKLSTNKKNITKLQACDILSTVGLCAKEYVDREINSSLSGGELKRIEIASVIAREVSLTVFDEPEAGIDLWSFNNLTSLFKKMRKDKIGSTIIISHQERILNIADQIIILNDGKIGQIGSKEEVLKNVLTIPNCCKLQGGAC